MNYYITFFLFFLSYSLFSQIVLPTFHATQNVKSVVNNFQPEDPLIVAGGGGGVIYWMAGHLENHASITESGNKSNDYSHGHYGVGNYTWFYTYRSVNGGTNGNGGSSSRGGGGGGFLTDGATHSTRTGTRGRSFKNGGEGGAKQCGSCGDGGFGGGGAGVRFNGIEDQGGGGGGGYSGGAGGGNGNAAHGGGGGSYNDGANQVNTTYPNGNNGPGKVIITQGGSTWTFTTCGVSGRTGPTQNQCNSSYSGTNLAGNVTLVDGIQHWTIPATATYTIKAYGASGGDNGKDPNWSSCPYFCRDGGHGAIIQGDFTLASGTVLKILVGHHPENVNWLNGGGGGTFVVLSN